MRRHSSPWRKGRPAPGLDAQFAEFLERVLLHQAPLGRPEDVAFFLASYARDARARVEAQAKLPAFADRRGALQEALGLSFDGDKGEHLFRSTLVQTLFYGLFSAWVEVAADPAALFDWRAAGWSLHVPFVDTLFQRIATPQHLKPLGLDEPLHGDASPYLAVAPHRQSRFSLRPAALATYYATWPLLTQLAAEAPFAGLQEMRNETLIDRDRNSLEQHMRRYFDITFDTESLRESGSGPVADMARFNAADVRRRVLATEAFGAEHVQPYQLRPFEKVWCYHTTVRPIWNEPRPRLADRIQRGGSCLVSRAYRERPNEGPHMLISRALPDYHLLRPNSSAFMLQLDEGQANLSRPVRGWLAALGLPDPDADPAVGVLPWHHALAIGYAPAWLGENGDGIRGDWPRVPLPGDADLLRASAALGARLAALLDPDTPVPGVTAGLIDAALACVAVPAVAGGGTMGEEARALTAGWGRAGKDGAVMPGRGRVAERPFAAEKGAAAGTGLLGAATQDVFLNGEAFWRNVPGPVWEFTIGGYQVIKKWLSYRERPLLGRAMTPGEVRYVRDMARRLEAVRLMGPVLDANYRACAAAHVALPA